MADEKDLTYELVIQAPADQIYRAFTSASALREWLCDVSTTQPVEGGRIYLSWSRGYFASGYFTKLIPYELVSFSWIGKDEPGWTQVEVKIDSTEDNGKHKVILRHGMIGSGARWEQARIEIAKGWEKGLENLRVTLEEGRDLRVTDRPLIGIYPEDLIEMKKEARQVLNVPVDFGVRVADVVVGYGAEKAGILADDVIVAINGKSVDRIRSLGIMMGEFLPGDNLVVELYRGPEKMHFSVDTMLRKMDELPEMPEMMAKELESYSTKVLETIEGVLKDVSEAEASYSPGSEEWSIKETLVHLIHTERDLHSWINDLVSGQERFYDEWPGDSFFRIRATLTTYPSVDDLLLELRRSMQETVASVAFLDEKFTQRKASYWRLGTELMGNRLHYQEHIRQIENNIKAARAVK